jgi:hypothetical protein
MLSAILLFSIFSTCHSFGTLCGLNGNDPYAFQSPEVAFDNMPKSVVRNLKVAMIGDQGYQGRSQGAQNPVAVLKMIRNWIGNNDGFVIHAGDLEYRSNPDAWIEQVDAHLPSSIPYFITIGNHDIENGQWPSYQRRVRARYERSGVTRFCSGDIGVNEFCMYKGIHFVLSGAGTRGSGHEAYIDSAFNQHPAPWRICAWHKNQRHYQVGRKTNEVGYGVFDTCRRQGAMILTGHEHSYSRSKLMRSFANHEVSTQAELRLREGRSFVMQQGMAGRGIRAFDTEGRRNDIGVLGRMRDNPWFASSAALGSRHPESRQELDYGATLCTFNINGDPTRAECEFRDINGNVWDKYTVRTNLGSSRMADEFDEVDDDYYPEMRDCEIPAFLEFPILSGEDDVTLDAGSMRVLNPSSTKHHLSAVAGHSTVTQLTFRVNIPAGATVRHAYLQGFGESPDAPEDIEEGTAVSNIEISGRSDGPVVYWLDDDIDDFESGEVWISPDLHFLVNDLLETGLTNNTITLTLTGRGQDEHNILSYETSPCVAPTLVVELEPMCDNPTGVGYFSEAFQQASQYNPLIICVLLVGLGAGIALIALAYATRCYLRNGKKGGLLTDEFMKFAAALQYETDLDVDYDKL